MQKIIPSKRRMTSSVYCTKSSILLCNKTKNPPMVFGFYIFPPKGGICSLPLVNSTPVASQTASP